MKPTELNKNQTYRQMLRVLAQQKFAIIDKNPDFKGKYSKGKVNVYNTNMPEKMPEYQKTRDDEKSNSKAGIDGVKDTSEGELAICYNGEGKSPNMFGDPETHAKFKFHVVTDKATVTAAAQLLGKHTPEYDQTLESNPTNYMTSWLEEMQLQLDTIQDRTAQEGIPGTIEGQTKILILNYKRALQESPVPLTATQTGDLNTYIKELEKKIKELTEKDPREEEDDSQVEQLQRNIKFVKDILSSSEEIADLNLNIQAAQRVLDTLLEDNTIPQLPDPSRPTVIIHGNSGKPEAQIYATLSQIAEREVFIQADFNSDMSMKENFERAAREAIDAGYIVDKFSLSGAVSKCRIGGAQTHKTGVVDNARKDGQMVVISEESFIQQLREKDERTETEQRILNWKDETAVTTEIKAKYLPKIEDKKREIEKKLAKNPTVELSQIDQKINGLNTEDRDDADLNLYILELANQEERKGLFVQWQVEKHSALISEKGYEACVADNLDDWAKLESYRALKKNKGPQDRTARSEIILEATGVVNETFNTKYKDILDEIDRKDGDHEITFKNDSVEDCDLDHGPVVDVEGPNKVTVTINQLEAVPIRALSDASWKSFRREQFIKKIAVSLSEIQHQTKTLGLKTLQERLKIFSPDFIDWALTARLIEEFTTQRPEVFAENLYGIIDNYWKNNPQRFKYQEKEHFAEGLAQIVERMKPLKDTKDKTEITARMKFMYRFKKGWITSLGYLKALQEEVKSNSHLFTDVGPESTMKLVHKDGKNQLQFFVKDVIKSENGMLTAKLGEEAQRALNECVRLYDQLDKKEDFHRWLITSADFESDNDAAKVLMAYHGAISGADNVYDENGEEKNLGNMIRIKKQDAKFNALLSHLATSRGCGGLSDDGDNFQESQPRGANDKSSAARTAILQTAYVLRGIQLKGIVIGPGLNISFNQIETNNAIGVEKIREFLARKPLGIDNPMIDLMSDNDDLRLKAIQRLMIEFELDDKYNSEDGQEYDTKLNTQIGNAIEKGKIYTGCLNSDHLDSMIKIACGNEDIQFEGPYQFNSPHVEEIKVILAELEAENPKNVDRIGKCEKRLIRVKSEARQSGAEQMIVYLLENGNSKDRGYILSEIKKEENRGTEKFKKFIKATSKCKTEETKEIFKYSKNAYLKHLQTTHHLDLLSREQNYIVNNPLKSEDLGLLRRAYYNVPEHNIGYIDPAYTIKALVGKFFSNDESQRDGAKTIILGIIGDDQSPYYHEAMEEMRGEWSEQSLAHRDKIDPDISKLLGLRHEQERRSITQEMEDVTNETSIASSIEIDVNVDTRSDDPPDPDERPSESPL